jgi:hypothetical protein
MVYSHKTQDQIDRHKNAAHLNQWLWEKDWHAWFAWHPVLIAEDQSAWLQFVQRRLSARGRLQQPPWWFWRIRDFEYRLVL